MQSVRSLSPDRVEVWPVTLSHFQPYLASLQALLSPEEQAKADRLRQAADRDRFVLTRALLRHLLSRYTGIPPAAIQFGYGAAGKPFLSQPAAEEAQPLARSIQFNLSHSHDRALYAVTLDRRVGVDIEQHRPCDYVAIADRFFTPAEAAAIRSLPPALQARAFFNGWTRKEAYLKAIGTGLQVALDRVEVALLPDEPARLRQILDEPAAIDRWTLTALEVGETYAAALVVEGKGWSMHKLSDRDVISAYLVSN